MDPQLRFENEMVLDLVQVLVGSITPGMQAIALEANHDQQQAVVYFAFGPGTTDDQTVDDILFELDALTGAGLSLRAQVWDGPDWTQGWPGADKRLVYAAAPSRDAS